MNIKRLKLIVCEGDLYPPNHMIFDRISAAGLKHIDDLGDCLMEYFSEESPDYLTNRYSTRTRLEAEENNNQ